MRLTWDRVLGWVPLVVLVIGLAVTAIAINQPMVWMFAIGLVISTFVNFVERLPKLPKRTIYCVMIIVLIVIIVIKPAGALRDVVGVSGVLLVFYALEYGVHRIMNRKRSKA